MCFGCCLMLFILSFIWMDIYIFLLYVCYVCIVINMWGNINSSTVDTKVYDISRIISTWEHSKISRFSFWSIHKIVILGSLWNHLNSHDQTMLTHHFYRLFNFMHYKFSYKVFQKINKRCLNICRKNSGIVFQ